MNDLISRQAVKEQMIKYGFHAPDMTVTEFVEDLPPANPTRERGEWILINPYYSETNGGGAYVCSECHHGDYGCEEYNFCFNCGADMRGKNHE